MVDEANEEKKTTVLARIERLRELVEEDEPAECLERAYDELGRELDGMIRPDRAKGEDSPVAVEGESPPAL